ncbi:unnamed protein product [Amoebophrya sp. A25]|nr:unnamed protein product [Amoebophrya sp. A25]|eukprot:GSA25T00012676001.1
MTSTAWSVRLAGRLGPALRWQGERTASSSSMSVRKFSFVSSRSSLVGAGSIPSGSGFASRIPAAAGLVAVNPAGMSSSTKTRSDSTKLQRRTMFDWALRPYACAAAANSATGLSMLNAGFSKCSLSLLVCPWKALPTALVILPMAWAVPAVYRMCFSNCSRGAVAGVFTFFMQFTLTFLPVPCFENLFAELTFYITALCMTFLMYNLFPELMLEDGIWIFYSALFVMPMLPLAFSYLPLFATRTYLIL